MTRIAIRKLGGVNIVSLPKAVLKTLGLHEGSTIDLSLEDNSNYSAFGIVCSLIAYFE